MKYLYLYIIFIIPKFVFVVSSEVKKNKFFPNLPFGEYKIHYSALLKCNSPSPNMINHFYLSKTSSNSTELRGNFTLKKPLNDDLTGYMNMAIKDSIGSWKDNAHLIKIPKICSQLKIILGEEWRIFWKSFGIKNSDCPIVPGVYVSRGYDLTSALNRSHIPKSFFYGTYKTRIQLINQHNEEFGCLIFIIDIKRPWET